MRLDAFKKYLIYIQLKLMKNKRLLLNVIIRISLLCTVTQFNNADGMNCKIYTSKHPNALKGFLSMSFDQVIRLTGNLPDEYRNEIRRKILDDNDKKYLMYFNIATRLLPELQHRVALNLFNDGSNPVRHRHEINNFLIKPLGEKIHTYWMLQAEASKRLVLPRLESRISNAKSLIDKYGANPVYEFLDEITIVEHILEQNAQHKKVTHKELTAFNIAYNTVMSKFDKISNKLDRELLIKYNYRDVYTLTNFMKYQSIQQWYFLLTVLTPFLFQFIRDAELPEAEILSTNEKKEILNAFIQRNFEKTGDKKWLSFIEEIITPEERKVYGKVEDMVTLSCIYGAQGVSVVFVKEYFYFIHEKFFKYIPENWVCVSIGMGAWVLAFALPCIFLNYKFFDADIMQQPILGMTCAATCYASILSIMNVIRMRSLKEERVAIAEIPQLLNRIDIEIV